MATCLKRRVAFELAPSVKKTLSSNQIARDKWEKGDDFYQTRIEAKFIDSADLMPF